jgi:hypothetical protein
MELEAAIGTKRFCSLRVGPDRDLATDEVLGSAMRYRMVWDYFTM